MAKSINLLTLADGFGDSIACPSWYPEYTKWPEIIKLMTKGVNLINLSRYGAGNEYITHCLKENIKNKNPKTIMAIATENVWPKYWVMYPPGFIV